MPERCPWPLNDPLMIRYHDEEWGTPVHDDRLHFEYMVLDAFQAGLSWSIVLHKRENFRRAFRNFTPQELATCTGKEIEEWLQDAGIIRNRRKLEATILNAQQFLRLQEKYGSFDDYIWDFISGKTIHNGWHSLSQIPASTELSDRISRDLRQQGFKFVGSTICYSYLQAAGLVNDHLVNCFRYQELTSVAEG